jgi:L-amino acid N-acyltransferase YncA
VPGVVCIRRGVYAGVGEHGVYVERGERGERGRGTGRALLEAVVTAAEERGSTN